MKLNLEIGSLEIRNLKTPTDYAMFALWAITKGLNVELAVKSIVAYQFLVKKYITISVKQRGFTDAMGRESNASMFKKNAEGLYYLTSQAQIQVETWINGASLPSTFEDVNDTLDAAEENE